MKKTQSIRLVGKTLMGVLVLSAMMVGSAAHAGVFVIDPLTGDGDSGVSSSKIYTHAVDFGGLGETINGVDFTIGGQSGVNYNLTGNGATANLLNNVTGQMNVLIYTLMYDSGGNPTTLTLTGLTAGYEYETAFYSASFSAGPRIVDIYAIDGGELIGYNQDGNGVGNGSVIRYSYFAPLDGIFSFDFSGGFLNYGFSNEQITAVPEPGVLGLAVFAVGTVFGISRFRRSRRSC